MSAEIIEFTEAGSNERTLIVDVEGFEGPLDLLLTLAREQKVDLAKISILALANQYLEFIEAARQMRLELAADYLVMAAWLAYLKSRLLLPEAAGPEGMSAADMATALAQRLRQLEAIRIAAGKLFDRPLLGRDTFDRGDPEAIEEIRRPEWSATLYDLLSAYARERQKQALAHVRFAKRTVWSLVEAREALERMVGGADDWARLDQFLIAYVVDPKMRATAMASSLAATLELIREGQIECHQHAAFAPIYLRKRSGIEPQPNESSSGPAGATNQ
ncbi:MAG: segregation and condensation protein A [Xanthobacteraceae bacterium]